MNILQINATDNPVGGAARITLDLQTYFKEHGQKSALYAGSKYSLDETILPIPKTLWQKSLSRLLADDISFYKTDFILNTEVYKKADIIHCHNLHGRYFNLNTLHKMSLEKPIIWTFHDMWPITEHCAHAYDCSIKDGLYTCPSLDSYPGILWHNEKKLRSIKKNVYEKSNFTIVVPSRWLKEKITGTILESKPIHVIPNGIDTSMYTAIDKKEARQVLGLDPNAFIVLFAANLGDKNPFKGSAYVSMLAEKYRNQSTIQFVCVGGHVDYQNMNIIQRKQVSDKKIFATYLSAADILLFPSLAENFPLMTLEAMACGLPILAFDVGGTKEAVAHKEHGYIARYKDSNDLVAGLEWLRSLSVEEKSTMANLSRTKIQTNYTIEIMAQKYLALYESLQNAYNKDL